MRMKGMGWLLIDAGHGDDDDNQMRGERLIQRGERGEIIPASTSSSRVVMQEEERRKGKMMKAQDAKGSVRGTRR
jgi:hypothetical protein